jgi:hypothetical protein
VMEKRKFMKANSRRSGNCADTANSTWTAYGFSQTSQ